MHVSPSSPRVTTSAGRATGSALAGQLGNFGDIILTVQLGLPVLLGQLLLTLLIWLASVALSLWITPCHEIRQLRAQNIAMAITAGGAALALAIPLAFCLAGAINAWDIMLWAIPVTLLQLSAFWLSQLIIPNLCARLEGGDISAALFLLFFRIGFACLNAAAITA